MAWCGLPSSYKLFSSHAQANQISAGSSFCLRAALESSAHCCKKPLMHAALEKGGGRRRRRRRRMREGAAIRNTLGRRQHDVCKTVMESAPSTNRSRSASGLPATQVPCDTEAKVMDPLGACSGVNTASCACDLGSAPGMRSGRCKFREARSAKMRVAERRSLGGSNSRP